MHMWNSVEIEVWRRVCETLASASKLIHIQPRKIDQGSASFIFLSIFVLYTIYLVTCPQFFLPVTLVLPTAVVGVTDEGIIKQQDVTACELCGSNSDLVCS